jgi:metal-responsive CopG/Arc/MetJ family transcriptional regulator
MRTTVELPDHLRARLLELAARRGLKGFSQLVQEAVEQYLAQAGATDDRIDRAIDVLGTLDGEQAEELQRSVEELRRRWR